MGRKGVSKRKPKQTKKSSMPVPGNASSDSSVNNRRQPLQVTEKSVAAPTIGNETKPSAGANKKHKKR